MSVYQVNRILYRIEMEQAFQDKVRANPAEVVAGADLSDTERTALINGDVGTLFLMGAHPFLLMALSRHGIFGVTRENYLPRIRAAVSADAQKRG
jgi:Aromatic-ring-opening dioxygenase LigAB, LigA subunit